MTFASVQLYRYRCRTKPDSTSRSGRVKGRCALVSAAARRDRASGLGRYLSVESASCGLECRALEANKTCRLELTHKRIWVSSVYVTIFLIAWTVSKYTPVVLIIHHKMRCLFPAEPGMNQMFASKKGRLLICTVVTSNKGFVFFC